MLRTVFNLIVVCLLLTSTVFAVKVDEDHLAKEYGRDLVKAPFFLRFAYSKQFNKDWSQSDYIERREFLTDYDINHEKLVKKYKEEAKAQELKEKQEAIEKKQNLLIEKAKLKEEKAKLKAKQQEDAQRLKDFYASEKYQADELAQMKKTTKQKMPP